ncbi:MAG: hypothetical protein J0I25_12155 [Sphingomonadales bacterium]|nr:hypothetical protein [Sphingomonadales bacterium]
MEVRVFSTAPFPVKTGHQLPVSRYSADGAGESLFWSGDSYLLRGQDDLRYEQPDISAAQGGFVAAQLLAHKRPEPIDDLGRDLAMAAPELRFEDVDRRG